MLVFGSGPWYNGVLFVLFEAQFHSVAQAGLKFTEISLLLPPEC